MTYLKRYRGDLNFAYIKDESMWQQWWTRWNTGHSLPADHVGMFPVILAWCLDDDLVLRYEILPPSSEIVQAVLESAAPSAASVHTVIGMLKTLRRSRISTAKFYAAQELIATLEQMLPSRFACVPEKKKASE